jgi:hypothetical protein
MGFQVICEQRLCLSWQTDNFQQYEIFWSGAQGSLGDMVLMGESFLQITEPFEHSRGFLHDEDFQTRIELNLQMKPGDLRR